MRLKIVPLLIIIILLLGIVLGGYFGVKRYQTIKEEVYIGGFQDAIIQLLTQVNEKGYAQINLQDGQSIVLVPAEA